MWGDSESAFGNTSIKYNFKCLGSFRLKCLDSFKRESLMTGCKKVRVDMNKRHAEKFSSVHHIITYKTRSRTPPPVIYFKVHAPFRNISKFEFRMI